MKKDSGFIEYNAALLLFFIAALISGGALYTSAAINLSRSDNRDFNNKLAADLLLDEIIGKTQPLRLYQYDDKNNALIKSLCHEYESFRLEITDVSSGYHLDFLSDEDMADLSLTGLLFLDNSGTNFTSWRNANGLSVSKTAWREFVKEEAWPFVVSYGWLNKNDTESFAFRNIRRSFAVADPDKLFPLVNHFPRMNVNMVNPEILRPLIARASFKIEKPNEKADTLINRLKSGPASRSDISSILDIPDSHQLMSYLGTKTAFWKLRFIMPSSLAIEAIIAAVPNKDGGAQEVALYKLIDRYFTR